LGLEITAQTTTAAWIKYIEREQNEARQLEAIEQVSYTEGFNDSDLPPFGGTASTSAGPALAFEQDYDMTFP